MLIIPIFQSYHTLSGYDRDRLDEVENILGKDGDDYKSANGAYHYNIWLRHDGNIFGHRICFASLRRFAELFSE